MIGTQTRTRVTVRNAGNVFPPDPMGRLYLFWPIIELVVVLAIFGFTLNLLKQNLEIERTWDVVHAKVVNSRQESRTYHSKKNGTYSKVITTSDLEYSDRNGKRHTFTLDKKIPDVGGYPIYSDPSGSGVWHAKGEHKIWLPAPIGSGIAALVASILLLWLLRRLFAYRHARELLRSGTEITAVVTAVRSRVFRSRRRRRRRGWVLSGQNTEDVSETAHYQVVAEWQSPIGEKILFESYGINWNPGQIEGCKIPVIIDQSDPANLYYLGEGEIERVSRPRGI